MAAISSVTASDAKQPRSEMSRCQVVRFRLMVKTLVYWAACLSSCPKQMADLHLHVDRDALDFFCETGRGYQSRVNAVLRSYVERARHK